LPNRDGERVNLITSKTFSKITSIVIKPCRIC
jgi:hypothetical protein